MTYLTLYHWSPRDRRKQILRYGLKPGVKSRDGLWKPPYVCLSDRPSLAWSLSGGMRSVPKGTTWDLWEVWLGGVRGYEVIPRDDGSPKEYRVYERIYKRDMWWAGERVR